MSKRNWRDELEHFAQPGYGDLTLSARGALAEIDRLRASDATKDARIAELEEEARQYSNSARSENAALRAEIEALRKENEFMRGHGIVQDNETLRKRVGELEADNKASGAICDLVLASTDSWKARAEQAEKRVRELEAELRSANERARDFEDAVDGWIGDFAEMKLRAEEAETDRATTYARGDNLLARAEQAEAQLTVMQKVMDLWYDKNCDCEMCCQVRAALQQTAPATVDPTPCEGAEFGPT